MDACGCLQPVADEKVLVAAALHRRQAEPAKSDRVRQFSVAPSAPNRSRAARAHANEPPARDRRTGRSNQAVG